MAMKCTEQWRYNILTSNKAQEYREKENARCRAAYYAKKGKGKQSTPSAAIGAPDLDDTLQDKEEKSKEQSRLR